MGDGITCCRDSGVRVAGNCALSGPWSRKASWPPGGALLATSSQRAGLRKARALGSLPSQGCEFDNRVSQLGQSRDSGMICYIAFGNTSLPGIYLDPSSQQSWGASPKTHELSLGEFVHRQAYLMSSSWRPMCRKE